MRKQNVFWTTVFLFATTVGLDASAFQVTIFDTLQPQTGFLAFDFLAGSPQLNNTAVIDSFLTNGILNTFSISGSVIGTLTPGPLTLTDSSFFNEWLQGFTYGSTISFNVKTGDSVSQGGIPDSFGFYLLDSNRNPFLTSDPSGADALFTIDLNGSQTTPTSFVSTVAQVSITPVSNSLPEPSSLLLTLPFIVFVMLAISRRPAHSQENNVNYSRGLSADEPIVRYVRS